MRLDVGLICGSLRKDSFSKKLGEQIIKISPNELSINFIDISLLDLYNEDRDMEDPRPKSWEHFRNDTSKKKGIIFVTPEYNRSIPGALKNAIDVGSRPYGKNIWAKKPSGIISISQGALGGFGANQHIRQSLSCLDVPLLHYPEAYIGNIQKIFDEKGNSTESMIKFLQSFMVAYQVFLKRNL